MMRAALRPYQVEAVENIRAALRRGRRRVLLTLPTGAGKTLTAASMIAGALERGKRSLFVAHRKELIDQTVAAFARLGITSVGVIRASDRRRDSSQPIQVASVQTLARRKQDDFDLVFVDEAHRSPARTYAEHVFERHKRAVIVGLSATPVRQDNKPLVAQFDELVVGARYSDLIAAGYLAAPLVYSTPLLPDLGTVRTSGGDFNAEDLENAVNRGSLIGDLYTQWAKHPPARTVAFAVSVAHSRAIVERFAAEGVRAEHLDGTTPEDERAAILARLASGATTLLSNVGVLCEGWDLPSCKRLIVARPTKSLGLYMQMAGRILRPHDGETPIILDHGGNFDRHGAPHLDREWSLDAKPRATPGVAPSRVCPECFAHILASSKVCPLCGAEQPSAEKPPAPPLPEVDLALRALVAVDGLEGDAERLSSFRALYRTARARGWMFQAVLHRYRELHGEDAPPAWVAALRSDYRGDAAWKESVAQKKRERAAREAGEERAA
jgi:superfamily II DNA or RNA helicase